MITRGRSFTARPTATDRVRILGGGRRGRFGRGHFFYDPFYDPFFYNRANIVRYPERTVSFQNGRVIAFQFLPAPRFY